MKAKLKLHEVLTLDTELNGFMDLKTGEVKVEGLLNQKIDHSTKYRLKSSVKKIQEEKQIIEETKNEIIQKYGEADQHGNIRLNMFLDETDEVGQRKINEKYIKYQEEYMLFLNSNDVEVEIYDLTTEDLKHVLTTDYYKILDTYFIKEPTE
jgi:hypothetical protein